MSIGFPGPTIRSHQPGLPVSGCALATCWSPVSAWNSRIALPLSAASSQIEAFKEKPQGDGAWINGGYFVLDRKVLTRIEGDDSVFEQTPMRSLAHDGQLHAFRHDGFWQPMDTLRDKHVLEELWESGKAPWKKW